MKKIVIFDKINNDYIFISECSVLNYYYGIEFNDGTRLILTGDYTLVSPEDNFRYYDKLIKERYDDVKIFQFDHSSELFKWVNG